MDIHSVKVMLLIFDYGNICTIGEHCAKTNACIKKIVRIKHDTSKLAISRIAWDLYLSTNINVFIGSIL